LQKRNGVIPSLSEQLFLENIGDDEEEIIDKAEFIGFKNDEDDENFSSSKSLSKIFRQKIQKKRIQTMPWQRLRLIHPLWLQAVSMLFPIIRT
jgi:hypothetical protein